MKARARHALLASASLIATVWAAWPGSSRRPQPTELSLGDVRQISDAVRSSLLAGESVEIVRHEAVAGADPPAGRVVVTTKHEVRRLTDEEEARAIRLVDRLLGAAQRPLSGEKESEVNQEQRIAQRLKDRALLAAVKQTLEEGHCFLTKHLIMELRSDEHWHYWNVDLPLRDGSKRWTEVLYVPIDLTRFPEVSQRKARLAAVREFKRHDDAHTWNSKPYAERRELTARATAAFREYAELEQQLKSTAGPAEKRELARRMEALRAVIAAAPSEYDPGTLEVRVR